MVKAHGILSDSPLVWGLGTGLVNLPLQFYNNIVIKTTATYIFVVAPENQAMHENSGMVATNAASEVKVGLNVILMVMEGGMIQSEK